MKIDRIASSDTAAGLKSAAEITDKRGFALRWMFSVRHIDNLLKQRLPHLKVGERRVRILIPEADAWMHERFSTQHHR